MHLSLLENCNHNLYRIGLKLSGTSMRTSTRLASGEDFESALDKSLEENPEEGWVIYSAEQWNTKTSEWIPYWVPEFHLHI